MVTPFGFGGDVMRYNLTQLPKSSEKSRYQILLWRRPPPPKNLSDLKMDESRLGMGKDNLGQPADGSMVFYSVPPGTDAKAKGKNPRTKNSLAITVHQW